MASQLSTRSCVAPKKIVDASRAQLPINQCAWEPLQDLQVHKVQIPAPVIHCWIKAPRSWSQILSILTGTVSGAIAIGIYLLHSFTFVYLVDPLASCQV